MRGEPAYTAESYIDPAVNDALTSLAGDLANFLPTLLPLFLIPFVMLVVIKAWRLFRDIADYSPRAGVETTELRSSVSANFRRQELEAERRPKPAEAVAVSRRSEFAKRVLLVIEAGERPTKACECPVCTKAVTTPPELTPPSLDDWADWEFYGLVKAGAR